MLSTSNGLIYINDKKNLSLKLSKKIIPEEYGCDYLEYFIKLENDMFIVNSGLMIMLFKIFLPEIKIIGYSFKFVDEII